MKNMIAFLLLLAVLFAPNKTRAAPQQETTRTTPPAAAAAAPQTTTAAGTPAVQAPKPGERPATTSTAAGRDASAGDAGHFDDVAQSGSAHRSCSRPLGCRASCNGFEIWDISNPAKPAIVNSYTCPASHNDVSVYKNLLFMSSEATNSRQDCKFGGVPQPSSEIACAASASSKPRKFKRGWERWNI